MFFELDEMRLIKLCGKGDSKIESLAYRAGFFRITGNCLEVCFAYTRNTGF